MRSGNQIVENYEYSVPGGTDILSKAAYQSRQDRQECLPYANQMASIYMTDARHNDSPGSG